MDQIATLEAPEWRHDPGTIGYGEAVAAMEARVDAIVTGRAPEMLWLTQHEKLYTAGTSASAGDILGAGGLPVFATGRGGQVTYHGPGQRIVYVMLDLRRRGQDLRAFVRGLEGWIIAALARLGVRGERRDGRVGIWVARGGGCEDKIAAIGIRVRHWVTFHGIAINVDCDLAPYAGIVPCGVRDPRFGVTSLADLGAQVTMDDLDAALRETFEHVFVAPQSRF